ncbi:MAG: gliding motility-associated C-terminal domain-containing protein [Bacteroidetes bacterium]|nr:gliding motility-associated C-terminal domain-containing protein [Bacteroidota bacterium]
MKKALFLLCLLLFFFQKNSNAAHLKGGWIQYQYISTDSSAKTNRYKITVRQYMLCSSTSQQVDSPSIALGIFDGFTTSLFRTITINKTSTTFPNKSQFDPCITPTPTLGSVCYRIDVYETIIDLPFKDDGYYLSVQRCCRIANIINVLNSDDFGLTYTNRIPGKIFNKWYANDNSPTFATKDTVIICHNSPFTFDFSATDIDGDSLRYSFCDGLTGGNKDNPKPTTPSQPPYSAIDYNLGFSGTSPLGSAVTINSKTGIISGIAPDATGEYVIAVCVNEYRNGILIGTTRKEIHINVANCQLSAANLKPTYITCDDKNFVFQNESSSSSITGYKWSFGDGLTSNLPSPPHTYADTGVYILKLVVQSLGCTDSAQAIVKVFPGFVPDFTVSGFCYQTPFQFKNTTYAKYGYVDSVYWDFGETSLSTDTSTQKNPLYKYLNAGQRTIKFYAHSNKGCEKDTFKIIDILDRPSLKVAFKDTLICSIDTLQILATSTPKATFKWVPPNYISNNNIANPYVFPKDTMLYIVTATDSGCVSRDTIKVNVLDYITVDAGPNINLCLTDSYKMKTASYALSYVWTPTLTLNDSTLKFPIATPTNAVTKYYVKANLGKCQDNDSVTLFTFPYPIAKVSADTSICFGDSVQIFGQINNTNTPTADTFYWSPIHSLNNSRILNPIAKPDTSTHYTLTSQFFTGCLKKVRDTVFVNVVQPFTVFAGRDTSVVFNQPLQLNAIVKLATDKQFTWTDLATSSVFASTQNPIVTFSSTVDSVVYKVRAYTKENCFALDTIKIKVFKTIPSIFIPDAFTPNGDGLNDIIKPVCVGITKLNYFNIFNRWGQMLFTTSQIGKGWDGKLNGTKQNSGTFIYTVEGIDYLGNVITKKGTIVLIQ